MGKSEYQLLIGASGKSYVMGGVKMLAKNREVKSFMLGKN